MAPTTEVIRAAGVVVMREAPDGQGDPERAGTEVLLIHRTQLQDWSLPKGKLDKGEHVTVAAVRETAEETGYDVVLSVPLATQRYPVGDRIKEVYYWLARITGRGPWQPNREVDEVRWVPIEEASTLLTYPRDADLVRAAALVARGTTPLVILRHAQAEKRVDFGRRYASPPPDSARPLTRVGERQAEELTSALAAFGITRTHSSPSTRCLDTVLPFAASGGLGVIDEPLLSEEGFSQSRKTAMKRISELLRDPAPAVLCTHRPVLPAAFEQVRRDSGVEIDPDLSPGGFVVLHRDFSTGEARIVAAEYHAP